MSSNVEFSDAIKDAACKEGLEIDDTTLAFTLGFLSANNLINSERSKVLKTRCNSPLVKLSCAVQNYAWGIHTICYYLYNHLFI